MVDEGEMIGDRDTIIAHVIARNGLRLDGALTRAAPRHDVLITRKLDVLGDVVLALEG
jgi:hypothetical protein